MIRFGFGSFGDIGDFPTFLARIDVLEIELITDFAEPQTLHHPAPSAQSFFLWHDAGAPIALPGRSRERCWALSDLIAMLIADPALFHLVFVAHLAR
jgi:hypothetical protein